MTGTTVRIRFRDRDAEHRFVTSYLPDAWDRFESSAYWETGWFWSYGQFIEYDVGLDHPEVLLVFDGDPDALVSSEARRWDSFAGLESWECLRYDDPDTVEQTYESLRAQQQAAKGERGGELEYRYKPLTSRLALSYRRTFDDQLPPVAARTDENPVGIGFWGLIHALFVQCGYDSYEETETYLHGIRSRLKSLALYLGEEAARAEYDRLLAEFEAFEAELDEWIDEQSTGTQTL